MIIRKALSPQYVLVLSCCFFKFVLWKNIHNIKFTILTILKCAVQFSGIKYIHLFCVFFFSGHTTRLVGS